MKHFDLLETRRKHVRKYSDKIPPKELFEKALWKRGRQHHLKTMLCLIKY